MTRGYNLPSPLRHRPIATPSSTAVVVTDHNVLGIPAWPVAVSRVRERCHQRQIRPFDLRAHDNLACAVRQFHSPRAPPPPPPAKPMQPCMTIPAGSQTALPPHSPDKACMQCTLILHASSSAGYATWVSICMPSGLLDSTAQRLSTSLPTHHAVSIRTQLRHCAVKANHVHCESRMHRNASRMQTCHDLGRHEPGPWCQGHLQW